MTCSLKIILGLKLTTFLGVISISCPVLGLRPFLEFFFRTTKFPKPESFTVSPSFKVCLTISRIISTSSSASCFGKPTLSNTSEMMSAFVIMPSSKVHTIDYKRFKVKAKLLSEGSQRISTECRGGHDNRFVHDGRRYLDAKKSIDSCNASTELISMN